jgi:hypothetical protein
MKSSSQVSRANALPSCWCLMHAKAWEHAKPLFIPCFCARICTFGLAYFFLLMHVKCLFKTTAVHPVCQFACIAANGSSAPPNPKHVPKKSMDIANPRKLGQTFLFLDTMDMCITSRVHQLTLPASDASLSFPTSMPPCIPCSSSSCQYFSFSLIGEVTHGTF